jgi:hypothetical protein
MFVLEKRAVRKMAGIQTLADARTLFNVDIERDLVEVSATSFAPHERKIRNRLGIVLRGDPSF